MLPRVSDALSKFVKPVASTGADKRVQENGFERARVPDATDKKKRKEKKGAKPELRVIPGGAETPPEPAHAQTAPPADAAGTADGAEETALPEAPLPMPEDFAPPGTPSVAHSFMNLLNQFMKTRANIVRWFGSQTYRTSAKRAGRQSGKFKKGTMLDENAE